MARGDDDIEKLLREVESALGSGSAGPAKGKPQLPARRDDPSAGAGAAAEKDAAAGVVSRVRAGVPRAVMAGAGCSVVVGGIFAVLPVVDAPSGALGAFVAAVIVSLAGRLRRRR